MFCLSRVARPFSVLMIVMGLLAIAGQAWPESPTSTRQSDMLKGMQARYPLKKEIAEVITVETQMETYKGHGEAGTGCIDIVIRENEGRFEAELVWGPTDALALRGQTVGTRRDLLGQARPGWPRWSARRLLRADELAEVRRAAKSLDECAAMGVRDPYAMDTWYGHLRKENSVGKILDLNASAPRGFADKQVQFFYRLRDSKPLEIRYNPDDVPAEMKLVYADVQERVWWVYARDKKIWVYVAPADADEGGYTGPGEPRGSWRELVDGKLRPTQVRPAWAVESEERERLRKQAVADAQIVTGSHPGRQHAGDIWVLGAQLQDGRRGTWLFRVKREPEKLLDEPLTALTLTSDGQWLIGTNGKRLVRYGMGARKEEAFADLADPTGWLVYQNLPASDRVVIVRYSAANWRGEVTSEFRVLDPKTGKTTDLTRYGLLSGFEEPFQRTAHPDEVWVGVESEGSSADLANDVYTTFERINVQTLERVGKETTVRKHILDRGTSPRNWRTQGKLRGRWHVDEEQGVVFVAWAGALWKIQLEQ